MTDHRRWFCRECEREWIEPRDCYANSSPVSITGNPINGLNCGICGSPEIQLVEYKPNYPGLDIPREALDQLKVIPMEVISSIQGRTNNTTEVMKVESWMGNRKAEELIIPPVMSRGKGNSIPEFD